MKQLGLVIIVSAAIGAAAFTAINDGNLPGKNSDEEKIMPQLQSNVKKTGGDVAEFTIDDVSRHNTRDDCWTIVNGEVYDITTYVPRHAGKEDILKACGANSTELFDGLKTASGEPVMLNSHTSAAAKEELTSYFIGTLEQ